MKYKYLIWILILIPIVSAGMIFKINDFAEVTTPCINNGSICSTSALCNITITYPNGTALVEMAEMSNQGSLHNYTYNASMLGTYRSTVVCLDNGITGYDTFEFKITGNGKEEASGIVTALFIIIFLIILIYLIIIVFYGIGHAVDLNYGLEDVGYNLGGFFALIGLFMLEKFYLGNLEIESFLELFIYIGAFTNVVVPIIAFILTLTVGPIMRKKREDKRKYG